MSTWKYMEAHDETIDHKVKGYNAWPMFQNEETGITSYQYTGELPPDVYREFDVNGVPVYKNTSDETVQLAGEKYKKPVIYRRLPHRYPDGWSVKKSGSQEGYTTYFKIGEERGQYAAPGVLPEGLKMKFKKSGDIYYQGPPPKNQIYDDADLKGPPGWRHPIFSSSAEATIATVASLVPGGPLPSLAATSLLGSALALPSADTAEQSRKPTLAASVTEQQQKTIAIPPSLPGGGSLALEEQLVKARTDAGLPLLETIKDIDDWIESQCACKGGNAKVITEDQDLSVYLFGLDEDFIDDTGSATNLLKNYSSGQLITEEAKAPGFFESQEFNDYTTRSGLREFQLISNTGGGQNDCLILSFLGCISKSFRNAEQDLRHRVASNFRRIILPSLPLFKTKFYDEYSEATRLANYENYVRIMKGTTYLDDMIIDLLARQYKITILYFEGIKVGQMGREIQIMTPTVNMADPKGNTAAIIIYNINNGHFESVYTTEKGAMKIVFTRDEVIAIQNRVLEGFPFKTQGVDPSSVSPRTLAAIQELDAADSSSTVPAAIAATGAGSEPVTIIMRHGRRIDDLQSKLSDSKFPMFEAWYKAENAKGSQARLYDPPLVDYACVEETAKTFKNHFTKITRIVSSPFLRCIQTAAGIAAKCGLSEIVINNNLGENYSSVNDYLRATRATFSLLTDDQQLSAARAAYLRNGGIGTLTIKNSELGDIKWDSAATSIGEVFGNDTENRMASAIMKEKEEFKDKGNSLLLVTHGDFTGALGNHSNHLSANYCGFYYYDSQKVLRTGTNIYGKDRKGSIEIGKDVGEGILEYELVGKQAAESAAAARLVREQLARAAGEAREALPKIQCPTCTAENVLGDTNCVVCGAPLPTSATSGAGGSRRHTAKRKKARKTHKSRKSRHYKHQNS
jgi:broad specificity phosphatase PhoE